ncbi:MAG: aldehyde dehydrogenase family protein [Pseudomonadota bacterium]
MTEKTEKIANELLEKASIAAAIYSELDQTTTDRIVEAIYEAAIKNRVKLARMANEETGIGIWEHKAIKNTLAAKLVYEDIKNEKTVGIISDDESGGIMEIAQALGPIVAVSPVTNPTSTIIFKSLITAKTQNPVIFSPHPSAHKCTTEAARICYEAALKAGAPDDCIQWVPESSRELTSALMSHPKTSLVLATGGPTLVKAAYSSGTPAFGVGSGNVPVYVEKTADPKFTAESILASKTFDNGTVCASEQAIVVEKVIAKELQKEFEDQGAYFLSDEEIDKISPICINPETGLMNPRIVGRSANVLAELAGISAPKGTTCLIAKQTHIGHEYPLSGEILAPILAWYIADGFDSALKMCIELNYRGGIGHTASIYSNDEESIMHFSRLMNAGRIVINTPSSQGGVGGIFNGLHTSFTLGCGAGGKNITTENITARNLFNIKRVCRRRPNVKWFQIPVEKILDDNCDEKDINESYSHNQ